MCMTEHCRGRCSRDMSPVCCARKKGRTSKAQPWEAIICSAARWRRTTLARSFTTPLLCSLFTASARCANITNHDDHSSLHPLLLYDFMSPTIKSTPLVAPGHTRPVTHLSFSPIQDDGTYLLVSSCKDGNPMLREWTGDWIGTFLGHKGAVWSTKISLDGSRAATASADFTAYVACHILHITCSNTPHI